MKKIIFLVTLLSIFIVDVKASQAVMPPDFIYNVGSQVFQIFSILFVFFAAIFSVAYQTLRTKFQLLKNYKLVIGISFLAIIIISISAAFYYVQYQQDKDYENWLVQSQENEKVYAQQSGGDSVIDPLDKLVMADNEVKMIDSDGDGLSDYDELHIYNTDPELTDTDRDGYDDKTELDNGFNPLVVQEELSKDKNIEFIEKYYSSIGQRNFREAYDMSKKSVDFGTFKSWYKDTTSVVIDKFIRIDETRSSLELTLFERKSYTRYGVLMTLNIVDGEPQNVEKSEVKILGEGIVDNISEPEIVKDVNVVDQLSQNIVITNKEFQNVVNADKDYIVLDAREDIEYKNGNFPGSLHIRFADIKAGRWIELPRDKTVYVFCWSGIRGKEVAEFLQSKNIDAKYLEEGANGWVEFGGVWEGNIKFSSKYSENRFRLVFSTDEFKDQMQNGSFVVDSREPYKFNQWHIPGSVNIPIMYTPSINLDTVFEQVPANSKIVIVCDNYVNCFDAKITGVELENRGNQFMGRYNKPWEYQNEN